MKLDKLLLIIFLLIMRVSQGQSPNIDSLIMAEFKTIKQNAHEENAFLEIIDDSFLSSKSVIGGRIVINKRQIINTVQQIRAKDENYVIRMFIAHEIAHQVLYRQYGQSQSVLLNECQADILTGFYIFQLVGEEIYANFDKYGKDAFSQANIQEALLKSRDPLNAIFNLGDRSWKEHSHPRDEQRRTAFRYGFNCGILWWLNSINDDLSIPNSQKTPIRKAIYELEELLNFTHGRTVVDWSYNRAKSIIHNDLFACKDIISYVDFKWNTKASYPFLEYTVYLKNIGQRKININFENQIIQVLRSDPKNSLYWDLIRSKSYNLYLKPDSFEKVSGKLEWTATSEHMPSFVSLERVNSHYSCSCEDRNQNNNIAVRHESKIVSEYQNNKNALGNIIHDSDNFESYINSIGRSEQIDFNKLKYITYDCIYQFPKADNTHLEFDLASQKYIMVTEWTIKGNETIALANVEDLLNVFKNELPEVTLKRDKIGKNTAWTLEANHVSVGKIYLFQYSTRYTIILKLFSNSN